MSDTEEKSGSADITAKPQFGSNVSLNSEPTDHKMEPPSNFKVIAPFALDMTDRDPTNMNDHLKVLFEDVIAEPEGTHSFQTIWRTSFATFSATKKWTYRILSAICGVPCAFCWGIHFACLTFCNVWSVVPSIKSYGIQLKAIGTVFGMCIRTFSDPCFESFGRIFGRMHLDLVRKSSKDTVLNT
ncbi:caveolin-3-like [Lingula anatina]|uniref:Caveolin n=1 Tax=Lingula anatina TaxID=7574 RepID=A0A1S3JHP2_LINAN|nr:caveolin-3-like [Lingula anatina]|eukprot:XP_013409414.1 caveolin-3-like [Lingula anatina]